MNEILDGKKKHHKINIINKQIENRNFSYNR